MRSALFSMLAALAVWGCTCSRTTLDAAEGAGAAFEGFEADAGLIRPRPASTGNGAQVAAKSATVKLAVKRCRLGSAQQTIRALGSVASEEDFAPFGVEIGAPLVEATGFSVPWLSSDGKTSSLGVTTISRDLLSARPTSLGGVHWDGGPPRLARVEGETLLAVVPDGDAHGESYRVAVVRGDGVTWGADLDGSSDDSPAFDFAASAGKAVLVWDDYVREEARGAIRGVLIGPNGALVRDLGRLSPGSTDVEAPRLAKHKNGYWLAWLRVAWEAKAKPAKTAPTAAPAPDPDQAALEVKQRWIEVVPLDLDGTVTGEPLRVSAADAMVQGFDLEAGHGGGLVLSWRQDFANSGTDGGSLWTARLDAGGALEAFPVEAASVGGTLPVLLFDPNPPSGVPHGWLSIEATGGDSAICALSPFGKPLEGLTSNVGLGVASVLGALEGQLLVAKPKGRDIVLGLAECKYSPEAAKAADAGVTTEAP